MAPIANCTQMPLRYELVLSQPGGLHYDDLSLSYKRDLLLKGILVLQSILERTGFYQKVASQSRNTRLSVHSFISLCILDFEGQ